MPHQLPQQHVQARQPDVLQCGNHDAIAVGGSVELKMPLSVEMGSRQRDGPVSLERVFDGFPESGFEPGRNIPEQERDRQNTP